MGKFIARFVIVRDNLCNKDTSFPSRRFPDKPISCVFLIAFIRDHRACDQAVIVGNPPSIAPKQMEGDVLLQVVIVRKRRFPELRISDSALNEIYDPIDWIGRDQVEIS
jgi:hypothetical protein